MKITRLNKKAFTLLELLAVLTILAIVVGIAGPAIFNQITKGKTQAAKAQIASIEKSLNTYFLDCGHFPAELEYLISPPPEGADHCWDKRGYLEDKKLPLDPWGRPFFYIAPGENRPDSFDLYSAGPDGQAGTEDDVTNWE